MRGEHLILESASFQLEGKKMLKYAMQGKVPQYFWSLRCQVPFEIFLLYYFVLAFHCFLVNLCAFCILRFAQFLKSLFSEKFKKILKIITQKWTLLCTSSYYLWLMDIAEKVPIFV